MAKILVVEDNEKNRILLREVLTYHGYEVIEAVNGYEALKAAREHKPALILMDIQMPVMDGLACVKLIREDEDIKHIKVIAFTALAMRGDRERLMEAGFDSYITKPVNIDRLAEEVKGFIGKKEE